MRAWIAILAGCLSSFGCSTLLDYEDVGFQEPSEGDSGGKTIEDGSVEADGAGAASGSSGSGGVAGSAPEDGATEGGSGGTPADATAELPPDPCDGEDCSGHGTCTLADGNQASCDCDPGYHAEGLQCVADESCTGVDCGRCGQCEVIGGLATCTCPDGFSHNGTGCVTDPNPCDSVDCGADAACVPEAHCQPLGACVPTCDCSNCGNCGPDNTDGRWNDWHEYCGAEPDESPATMQCNKPCPPGDGCLPYSTPICWPMEGCFSL